MEKESARFRAVVIGVERISIVLIPPLGVTIYIEDEWRNENKGENEGEKQ